MAKTAKDWETEIAAREAATEAHWKAKLDAAERMHKTKEAEIERERDNAFGKAARVEMMLNASKEILAADDEMLAVTKEEIERLRSTADKIGTLVESAGSLIDALRALEGGDLVNPILDALENNGIAIDDTLEAFEHVSDETAEKCNAILGKVDAAVADLTFWVDLDAKIDAEDAEEDFSNVPTVKIGGMEFTVVNMDAEPASGVEDDFFRRGGAEPLPFASK